MKIEITYTDGTLHRYDVEDNAALVYLLHNEGDHVLYWKEIGEKEDEQSNGRV